MKVNYIILNKYHIEDKVLRKKIFNEIFCKYIIKNKLKN